jgi:hypothetical protein
VQLVCDVEEVADVRRRVVLQKLEVGREIARQETLPDKDQHCAAYSEQGFLCSDRQRFRQPAWIKSSSGSLKQSALLPEDRQGRLIVSQI